MKRLFACSFQKPSASANRTCEYRHSAIFGAGKPRPKVIENSTNEDGGGMMKRKQGTGSHKAIAWMLVLAAALHFAAPAVSLLRVSWR